MHQNKNMANLGGQVASTQCDSASHIDRMASTNQIDEYCEGAQTSKFAVSSAQDLPMPYGYKFDIWSLACCMFEIVAHQPAFRASDIAEVTNKVSRSAISPLPIAYSSTLKQLIKIMLRKNPEHRPTAADLLRHALNISNTGTLC